MEVRSRVKGFASQSERRVIDWRTSRATKAPWLGENPAGYIEILKPIRVCRSNIGR